MNRILIYAFLLLSSFTSCLEPYDVNISNYENLLVVDALITDEIKSHRVYLTRSISNVGEVPDVESGALVTIVDENNSQEVLTEIQPGVYETNKVSFIAKVGSIYTLKIRTSKGANYQSKACSILPKSKLDKIQYQLGKGWGRNSNQEYQGLKILVDGSSYKGGCVRWLYDEDWMFRTPYPAKYAYNYSRKWWDILSSQNEYCWKDDYSSEILIHSFENQNNAEMKDKTIYFIPSDETDRLSVRYSVLLKQLSISKSEYEFWNKLKISSENVGDVFGTQPFSISGNMNNVNDPKEPVLGYFQTGSVSSKRIYIDRSIVDKFDLPQFPVNNGCSLDTFLADGREYSTALEIYEARVLNGINSIEELIYDLSGFNVIGMILTSNICADCALTGSLDKPEFWED